MHSRDVWIHSLVEVFAVCLLVWVGHVAEQIENLEALFKGHGPFIRPLIMLSSVAAILLLPSCISGTGMLR